MANVALENEVGVGMPVLTKKFSTEPNIVSGKVLRNLFMQYLIGLGGPPPPRGLVLGPFHYWRRRFGISPATDGFIEVQLTDSATVLSALSHGAPLALWSRLLSSFTGAPASFYPRGSPRPPSANASARLPTFSVPLGSRIHLTCKRTDFLIFNGHSAH